MSSLLERRRATWVLGPLAVVLALVGGGLASFLWAPPSFPLAQGSSRVSAERPVVVDELTYREAVDTAATQAKEILSTDYEDYQAEREEALGLMTDAFAQEYGQTLDDIQQEFVKQETRVTITVRGRGVVRASSEQVQTLLFLNQVVKKKGEPKTVTPYRALVTVTNTQDGWLVSDLQTK